MQPPSYAGAPEGARPCPASTESRVSLLIRPRGLVAHERARWPGDCSREAFEPTGDGAYLLRTRHLGTGLRTAVVDGGPDDGAGRLLPGETPSQQWVVEPIGEPQSFAVVSSAPVPFIRAGFVRLSTRRSEARGRAGLLART